MRRCYSFWREKRTLDFGISKLNRDALEELRTSDQIYYKLYYLSAKLWSCYFSEILTLPPPHDAKCTPLKHSTLLKSTLSLLLTNSMFKVVNLPCPGFFGGFKRISPSWHRFSRSFLFQTFEKRHGMTNWQQVDNLLRGKVQCQMGQLGFNIRSNDIQIASKLRSNINWWDTIYHCNFTLEFTSIVSGVVHK